MTFEEFAKQYGSLVVWTLAIIGWQVANYSANMREYRKEIRGDIDLACSLIEKILNIYFEYLRKSTDSIERRITESRIKMMFADLDLQIERLKSRKTTFGRKLLEMDSVVQNSDSFYDLITGGDFEAEGQPSKLDPLQDYRASHRALKLIDSLRKAFNQAFT
ncbi:hypothetical protein [Methyloversatilis sp.]|uniref:hypothetical protein n=1 Tax=Methyloversatilis sp. TaxID=2569862 RepID=UPI003D26BFEE